MMACRTKDATRDDTTTIALSCAAFFMRSVLHLDRRLAARIGLAHRALDLSRFCIHRAVLSLAYSHICRRLV